MDAVIIQVPWHRWRARDFNPALVVAIKKELQLQGGKNKHR